MLKSEYEKPRIGISYAGLRDNDNGHRELISKLLDSVNIATADDLDVWGRGAAPAEDVAAYLRNLVKHHIPDYAAHRSGIWMPKKMNMEALARSILYLAIVTERWGGKARTAPLREIIRGLIDSHTAWFQRGKPLGPQ